MAALTSLTDGLSSSLGSIGLSTVVLRGRIIDTEGVDSVLISEFSEIIVYVIFKFTFVRFDRNVKFPIF